MTFKYSVVCVLLIAIVIAITCVFTATTVAEISVGEYTIVNLQDDVDFASVQCFDLDGNSYSPDSMFVYNIGQSDFVYFDFFGFDFDNFDIDSAILIYFDFYVIVTSDSTFLNSASSFAVLVGTPLHVLPVDIDGVNESVYHVFGLGYNFLLSLSFQNMAGTDTTFSIYNFAIRRPNFIDMNSTFGSSVINDYPSYAISDSAFVFDDYALVSVFDNSGYLETGSLFDFSYGESYNSGYESGYDNGYSDGSYDGYDEGYDAGYEFGVDSGYDHGYDVGYQEGYDAGYDVGYQEGYDDGYDIGYQAGLDSTQDLVDQAYQDGYNSGYDDAVGSISYNVLPTISYNSLLPINVDSYNTILNQYDSDKYMWVLDGYASFSLGGYVSSGSTITIEFDEIYKEYADVNNILQFGYMDNSVFVPIYQADIVPNNVDSWYQTDWVISFNIPVSASSLVVYAPAIKQGIQLGLNVKNMNITISTYSGAANVPLAYNSGFADGRSEGLKVGYQNGYADAMNDSSNGSYTFTSLLSSVIEAPVNVLIGKYDDSTGSRVGGLFNFDFLGYNMSTFLMSLFSLALIICIARVFV